jgi:uncharacterized membrane protein (TIGR02234 family)
MPEPASTTHRARGYAATLALGLLAATTATVALARPWITATATQRGLPQIKISVTGAEVASLAGALCVVALASFGAVIATRGSVRRALGTLIVLSSAVIAYSALRPPSGTSQVEAGLSALGWAGGPYDMETSPWRWVTLAAALLCLATGVAVIARGHRWAAMGSRYDAPASRMDGATSTDGADGSDLADADVWREIDQGRDPTRMP